MLQKTKSLLSELTVRIVFMFVLCLATYNPWDYSYYSWVAGSTGFDISSPDTVGKLIIGLVILVLFGLAFRASLKAKGFIGVIITILIACGTAWYFVTQGWLDLDNKNSNIIVVEIIIAFVLGLGQVASKFWRSLTGQYNTDDPDED